MVRLVTPTLRQRTGVHDVVTEAVEQLGHRGLGRCVITDDGESAPIGATGRLTLVAECTATAK